MKEMHAKITWVPYEEGGRRSPMAVGVKYGPIIRFKESKNDSSAWSADIIVKEYIGHNVCIATVSYLFDGAPFQLLRERKNFTLHEGQKLVAHGIFLE